VGVHANRRSILDLIFNACSIRPRLHLTKLDAGLARLPSVGRLGSELFQEIRTRHDRGNPIPDVCASFSILDETSGQGGKPIA
jgi:hypothetical protein